MINKTGFLESKLKTLIEGKHRLTYTMKPDESYGQQLISNESKKLLSYVSKLSDEECKRIYNDGLEMQKSQDLKQGIKFFN